MSARTLAGSLALLSAVLAAAAGALAQPASDFQPPGFTGGSKTIPSQTDSEFVPFEDRWRLGLPRWDRYPGRPGEYPWVEGRWWDPYNQNVLKGDYPIIGNQTFFVFTALSDTLFEPRRVPTGSGVSTANPGEKEFFGQSDQLLFNQNLVLSFDLFHGNTAFKPRDWEIRITPVFNLNYVDIGEQNAVNVDPSHGTTRLDGHVGIQEAFVEYHLKDLSPWYDFVSTRVGIQGFTSDFRGFIFSDNNLGVRLFGNYGSNRQQYNLVYFRPLEKDTNSGLNRLFEHDPFDSREQDVVIANYYLQDAIWPGYTTQFSFHWDGDHADHVHFDRNHFIVRPAAIGSIVGGVGNDAFTTDPANKQPLFGKALLHHVDAYYLGWAGDGHIGRLNVNHAFYEVLGRDTRNPIAGRATSINAQMAAIELSLDRDWLRFKGSFFWASGDHDPLDGKANGFDTILDNTNFAGGGFSYWVRQGIPLATTRVNLVNRFSLLPSLRSSKIEGQPNFVNPGLFLYGVGLDADVTPKLKAFFQVNYLQFADTRPLEVVLQQTNIGRDIGLDYSIGLQYRPLLINNVILTVGAGALTPASGLRDLLEGQTLYSTFVATTL
ncbi:MAG TPA: hypothetical protein VMR29_10735, partial [Candidatus Binatia bacterium]|nr:hypothetical protein [Candidatus Binatia bacterium]